MAREYSANQRLWQLDCWEVADEVPHWQRPVLATHILSM